MTLSALHVSAITVSSASGSCGTCTWSLSEDGVFTLKPTDGVSGELEEWEEYSYFKIPWYLVTDNVKSVKVEGTVVAKTCNSMFMNFSKCESMDLSGLDVSNVTDFYGMFSGDSALVDLDLSSFNTAKATKMGNMFMRCVSLEALDLGENFTTSNVTSFYGMFSRCYSLETVDLSSFDTSNGVCFKGMFNMYGGESKLKSLKLEGWDMSKKDEKESDTHFFFYNCEAVDTIVTPAKLREEDEYVPKLWKDMYDIDDNNAIYEAKATIPAGNHTLVANDPTGIATIKQDANTVSGDNAWYTISGVRLTEKPTAPGVYINKGSKVVIDN